MIGRFSGPHGQRLLTEAIAQQPIIYGNYDIAAKVASLAELTCCDPGCSLIVQNSPDNDLYLIITGKFSVIVNGREVAQRKAGEHIGEMALIDPKAHRCASVVAYEPSVVAKLTEACFTELANEHPELWRGLARELGDRLRQRNTLVRQRHDTMRIFVGSSTETLPIANEIQAGLAHDQVTVTVWTNHVFGASKFFLESLEDATNNADFAVLVVGPDDKVISRGEDLDAPRDNVVFELGLFMGALGRRRVFIVMPRGGEIKIPTDLLGINPITYSLTDPKDLSANLGPACTALRKAINELGPK